MGVDDEAEKAKRFAEPKASVETSPENNEKRPQRWRLDDLVFVVLAALAFGLIATVVVIASGFLYFHFEGAWRPVIHAGDAPRYEACDRLSRVGKWNHSTPMELSLFNSPSLYGIITSTVLVHVWYPTTLRSTKYVFWLRANTPVVMSWSRFDPLLESLASSRVQLTIFGKSM